MLDDIKKIVPKMEKSDSRDIYNNIVKRRERKKNNIFNVKNLMVIASFIVLLAITIPIGIINGNGTKTSQSSENPPISADPTIDYHSNILLNETSLIGVAAYNEFDKNQTQKLSNISLRVKYSDSNTVSDLGDDIDNVDDENNYLKVSYPYDYVKILKAYKFSINISDIADDIANEIIKNSCGLGELEVVVAEFETYIDNNGINELSVQDTLISLRGYNGYYTILVNSGVYTNDAALQVFSSHKKLTEDEVSKDFTPPILSIFLKEENNSYYVYFETSNNLLSFGSYNQELAFKNINQITRVSRNTVYSVFDLNKLPVKEIQANVLEISLEENIIKVQTEFKLEYVLINEYTEGVGIEDINIGDVIIVEYDFLFEKYDPISVWVNSITINSVDEGE